MRYLILSLWLLTVGGAIGWLGLAAAEDAAGKVDHADAPELSIPFASRGGVRDWVAVDEATLLIQDPARKWYRVRLLAPARHLLHAEGLGFVTGPGGSLERGGAIVVRGQPYPIASITASEGPRRQRR